MTDITEADREAAAQNAVLVEMRDLIRAGRADHHAEPWAKHREAAEAKAIADVVAWLRKDADQAETCGDIADALESGAWRQG
jgi:hypothetical protein